MAWPLVHIILMFLMCCHVSKLLPLDLEAFLGWLDCHGH